MHLNSTLVSCLLRKVLKAESNQATLAGGRLRVSLLAGRADWMKDFSPFHHPPLTVDKQSRNCNCRYDPKTDTWTTVASLSIARDAVGVCLLGDRLYAVGGYDGQSYLSTVESYDAQNNEWTEVTLQPVCSSRITNPRGAEIKMSSLSLAATRMDGIRGERIRGKAFVLDIQGGQTEMVCTFAEEGRGVHQWKDAEGRQEV